MFGLRKGASTLRAPFHLLRGIRSRMVKDMIWTVMGLQLSWTFWRSSPQMHKVHGGLWPAVEEVLLRQASDTSAGGRHLVCPRSLIPASSLLNKDRFTQCVRISTLLLFALPALHLPPSRSVEDVLLDRLCILDPSARRRQADLPHTVPLAPSHTPLSAAGASSRMADEGSTR